MPTRQLAMLIGPKADSLQSDRTIIDSGLGIMGMDVIRPSEHVHLRLSESNGPFDPTGQTSSMAVIAPAMSIAPPEHLRAQPETDSRPLPYASMIHALLQEDRIVAARILLSFAMHERDVDPALLEIQHVLALPRIRRSRKTDFNRDDEYRWLERHATDHRNKWLAVSGHSLVAQADSLKELRAMLERLKLERVPIIHYVD
jgi:hypothetical protein